MLIWYIDELDGKYIWYNSAHKTGESEPSLQDVEIIYTQSESIINKYSEQYTVKILSLELGLLVGMSLYDVYSFFFEGKLISDLDMLSLIFKGLIMNSNQCYCMKVGIDFCLFTCNNSGIRLLDTYQSSNNLRIYSTGKSVKVLNFITAKLGYNLKNRRFICWDKDELTGEYSRYIHNCIIMKNLVASDSHLQRLNTLEAIKYFSNTVKDAYALTGRSMVTAMASSFMTYFSCDNDIIDIRSNIYKDYTLLEADIDDNKDSSYGLIIDCEGNNNLIGQYGCRELGGVIWCKQKRVITIVDRFHCDEFLLGETLDTVLKNYKDFIGRSKITEIPILTFGGADKGMLMPSLKEVSSKYQYKSYESQLKFIDARGFIEDFVLNNAIIVCGKRNLGNIAKSIGVLSYRPTHNPLNDSLTLFNILSYILQNKGGFPIEV